MDEIDLKNYNVVKIPVKFTGTPGYVFMYKPGRKELKKLEDELSKIIFPQTIKLSPDERANMIARSLSEIYGGEFIVKKIK